MKDYKRIATEEAFATRDQIALFRKLLADGYDDPGFKSLWGFYLNSPSERARFIVDRLQDLGPNRIADMDASGIDMQVLSLTSPGVQVFDAATANALAASSNDELADAIRKYPTRYVGLAAAAPQDPKDRREGNRARRAQARPQGRDHEFTHHGRAARRPEVLGHLRGRRSARRAYLPASRTRRRAT